MVFTKVNCLGDRAEGGGLFRGCGVIMLSADTSDNDRDRRVGDRHGGTSVTVDGSFE